MLDVVEILPKPNDYSFKLWGTIFTIPDYETADDFIRQLDQLGFLSEDHVVTQSLQREPTHKTERSVQRHFIQATGLSQSAHQRIEQAQSAVNLLQSGYTLIDAAYQAGYADQAHMTRTLKKLIGLTPSEIISAEQPIIIERKV
jgi:AraC-like DNA-binding protein